MYIDFQDAEDAVERCCAAAGPDDDLLLLVAMKSEPAVDAIRAGLSAKGRRFIGAIFPGLIEAAEIRETGLIATPISMRGEPAIAKVDGAALAWTQPLAETSDQTGRPCCAILCDFSCLGVDWVLEALHDLHGPDMDYFGAGAGMGQRAPAPVVFTHQGRFTGAAVIAYINPAAGLGVRHGWSRLSDPIIATQTRGNVLNELNWEPAMSVYRDIVGEEIAASLRSQLDIPKAKRFPFGIAREGLEDVVRDPLVSTGVNDLLVLSNVPENSVLHVLEAQTERLISAAQALGADLGRVQGAQRCLFFDCFSRVKLLGDDFGRELTAFGAGLRQGGSTARIEGALALGEIASDGARLPDFHNKTIAAALF